MTTAKKVLATVTAAIVVVITSVLVVNPRNIRNKIKNLVFAPKEINAQAINLDQSESKNEKINQNIEKENDSNSEAEEDDEFTDNTYKINEGKNDSLKINNLNTEPVLVFKIPNNNQQTAPYGKNGTPHLRNIPTNEYPLFNAPQQSPEPYPTDYSVTSGSVASGNTCDTNNTHLDQKNNLKELDEIDIEKMLIPKNNDSDKSKKGTNTIEFTKKTNKNDVEDKDENDGKNENKADDDKPKRKSIAAIPNSAENSNKTNSNE